MEINQNIEIGFEVGGFSNGITPKNSKSVSKSENAQVNDLKPELWRIYDEEKNLQFFTVWDTPERDPYKWTNFSIHGNSPVEIPRQCIVRFSKKGDKILDPFCGSGTTLVVCSHLKRLGTAVEINPNIFELAKKNVFESQAILGNEIDEWVNNQNIINGDSTKLIELGLEKESFDFCFAHPPYGQLVKYSEEYGYAEGDLSNEETLEGFNKGLKSVFSGVYELLKPGKFFCVLIGEDFKAGGKTIPLDYYATMLGMEVGFDFYTKIIKITRSAVSRKGNMNIQKFRSLRSNYFICNHDYVIIFKKPKA